MLTKVSACFKDERKYLTLNGQDLTFFDQLAPSGIFLDAATTVLQSKIDCDLLKQMADQDHKIFGYPTQSDLRTISFKVGNPSVITNIDVTQYFVNISMRPGKSTKREVVEFFAHLDEDDDLLSRDLDIVANTPSFLSSEPFLSDKPLNESTFSIKIALRATSLGNFHNLPCCIETFGLKPEASQGVLMQIIQKLQTCPTNFAAAGEFGSCGNTSKVTVTGTLSKKTMIDICGKTYCLTPLPSVKDADDIFMTGSGDLTTQCLTKFIVDYFTFGFSRFGDFAACGLDDEICRLISNPSAAKNRNMQLVIHCIDSANSIYGFAVLFDQNNQPFVDYIGCRFKLEQCKKCCN